jgi:type I restriction-modification system DNA methylase subunit
MIIPSSGKELILQKIADFEKNALILKKKGHGETNIRSNYIDVLFEALGWNMKSHFDVAREFSQKDASGTKKVDYAFKINSRLKFFVEAKEASIDLVRDKDAIYQAKRYAYSTNGKAPIVILTDFEEFRVFNVLKAPLRDNTDRELMKPFSMTYQDYAEQWETLWDTFSKEAVAGGSLERLCGKIDKNTKTMDIDFLEQITGWREDLARNIALRNKTLLVDDINEAVQRILDRLLFIRNLEDREIEPENTLLEKIQKTENIYAGIVPVFKNLDNVYNGLLFKKHFSEDLMVDDKTIRDIIKSMCYPVSPFQFDVIEQEILGRIYERFLGSKISLTDGHRAKIEEKIEVRKAGGVYYTPEYIVNYIVEHTVGKKIDGLNPDEIRRIKIVDPACGSGSFLLGAYSCLLDYHQKWYAAHPDKRFQKEYYLNKNGELVVTLDKRGDILRNNLFGVDIDQEATEVAIMSLYLKLLDDGFDKGQKDLFFIKGHVLPDMTDNIKCGNSLIGEDYFEGRLIDDDAEFKAIKPFDWQKKFAEIFKAGGFDCVIGNPPYGFHQIHSERVKPYLKSHYQSAHGSFEHYFLFYEKALTLLNENGLHGFIVPVTWLTIPSALSLRKFILENYSILQICWLPELVFENAQVNTLISIIKKREFQRDNLTHVKIYNSFYFSNPPIIEQICKQSAFISANYTINIFEESNDTDILNKIESHSLSLAVFAKPCSGYNPYEVGKGTGPDGQVQTKETVKTKPYHSEKKLMRTGNQR